MSWRRTRSTRPAARSSRCVATAARGRAHSPLPAPYSGDLERHAARRGQAGLGRVALREGLGQGERLERRPRLAARAAARRRRWPGSPRIARRSSVPPIIARTRPSVIDGHDRARRVPRLVEGLGDRLVGLRSAPSRSSVVYTRRPAAVDLVLAELLDQLLADVLGEVLGAVLVTRGPCPAWWPASRSHDDDGERVEQTSYGLGAHPIGRRGVVLASGRCSPLRAWSRAPSPGAAWPPWGCGRRRRVRARIRPARYAACATRSTRARGRHWRPGPGAA